MAVTRLTLTLIGRLLSLLDGRDPKSVVIEDYFKQRLELYMASLVPGVEDEEEGDDGYLTQEDLIHLCHEILEKCGVLHVQEFLGKLNQEAEAEAEAQQAALQAQQATLQLEAEANQNAERPECRTAGEHESSTEPGGPAAADLGA